LTERAVEKYLSNSPATVKGHLNQQRMSARSTKIKEELESVSTYMDVDYRIKNNWIYAAMIDAGQKYIDQTGCFPVISSKVNKYIMVLYEYDGNAILSESIKTEQRQNYWEHFKLRRQN
jgi:hypothetical protein